MFGGEVGPSGSTFGKKVQNGGKGKGKGKETNGNVNGNGETHVDEAEVTGAELDLHEGSDDEMEGKTGSGTSRAAEVRGLSS